MKKLPYIRQGQQLTIDILNGIIKAINSSILERKEYDSMMADITRMFNSYQSKVDNFILKYQDVVDNTPGLMDLLQSYSTLASMVNGTYVASIGSVNITSAGFNNIRGTMGRAQFEAERNYERTYPQYSSLLITEVTGATTLVYNVAPFESPPRWIEIDKIAGPQGPPGPPGLPGPKGEDGEDGEDGQVASIKGKVASLEECLSLDPAPRPNDAYVVEDGDAVNLYVFIGGEHTDQNSWVALNNIRGPVGPQGEMAEISIQYSNYADGSHASDVYMAHSFMIISEVGKSTRHIIKLTPKLKFEIVKIQESNNITTPYAEHSDQFFEASNETGVTTTITIPTLRTIESASLVGDNLHLKYRGEARTTDVGRVVFDPSKIIFTNRLAGLNISNIRNGDVIIDTSDYSIHNVVAGEPRLQGYLQGPVGPAGPVGASFKLVGSWVSYGITSTGAVTASEENVGNAYFLPADDDAGHELGLYVSSETSPGVYDWVFVGNSEGPQGETGAKGDLGPRGARITAGVEFYLNESNVVTVPANTSNAYKQNDLYLNTTSWDLFEVTAIGPAPSYTISAVKIGNIKGLGITNITFNSASEILTITYSNGYEEEVPIATIHVSSTEYGRAGLVVHKTDSIDPTDKGFFTIDNTIGTQSDPEDPGTFKIWGDATLLQKPGTASAGISTLIPRADHVHPAQTAITGNAGSANKFFTPRYIDGLKYDGSGDIATTLATCTNAADTVAKIATLTGFELKPGARIKVQFTNLNTAASPTLNVNDKGVKPVYCEGSPATAANTNIKIWDVIYDGTQWNLLNGIASLAKTATKLATEMTISLTGAVAGSVSFDGSRNASISTSVGTIPASDIDTDSTHLFVTETEKSTWNDKTPTSHATSSDTYGVATETNYGHAKASKTVPTALTASTTGALGTDNGIFARGDHRHAFPAGVLKGSISGGVLTITIT